MRDILLSLVLFFFPILVWMLYQIQNYYLKKEVKKLTFDFALFTSLYLSLKIVDNPMILLLECNAILILLFYKKSNFFYFILCFEVYYFKNMIFLFSLLFIFYEKKEYLLSVVLSSTFFFLYPFSNPIFFSFLSYFVSIFLLHFIDKLEDFILYSNEIEKLQDEKRLRNSLFEITHEIKNPIAVCKGYLDMFDVENKEDAKEFVPILKGEIEKVLILLQDFLSLRKIKIEKEYIDIYYLLENAVDSISPLLKKEKIHFTYLIPKEEVYLEADYHRLNQVILNLFKNSMEAMNDCLKKELKLSAKRKNNSIYIEIEDSGIGISKEELKHLDDPFYTTKRNGNGIGIYLSKEIMEKHGGKLTFISSENIGTKAIMILPLKEN